MRRFFLVDVMCQLPNMSVDGQGVSFDDPLTLMAISGVGRPGLRVSSQINMSGEQDESSWKQGMSSPRNGLPRL